jgi:hypothetical protein
VIDEWRRKEKMAGVRARWSDRAKHFASATWCHDNKDCRWDGCAACANERKRRYAIGRVVGVDKRIEARVSKCGTQEIPLACHCGPIVGVERCRQIWFCEVCQQLRAEKMQRSIADGLRAALRAEIDAWAYAGARGTRPHIRLLTLTTRHSGDLQADRRHLELGWRALYKAMHKIWGRFPYVGVWEVTPGTDGLGHVHAHVAVIWGYRDYAEVRELFAAGCDRAHLDIRPPRKDGKPSTGNGAAKYLGKYMSKGVQGDRFTPELRAEVAVAFYNAHTIFASTKFWRPHVNVCKCCSYAVKRVIVLDDVTFETWRDRGAAMYYVRKAGTGPPSPPVDDRTFSQLIAIPHGTVLVC